MENKKKIVGIVVCVVIALLLVGAVAVPVCHAVTSYNKVMQICRADGYDNYDEWAAALEENHNSVQPYKDAAIELDEYIEEEDKNLLDGYIVQMEDSSTIADFNAAKELADEIINAGYEKQEAERIAAEEAAAEEAAEEEALAANQVSYSTYDIPSLYSAGVVYWGSYRYTYYSSNVAYHYMTPQWHTNSQGFWCDSDGYLVVAMAALSYGSIVDTPWGTAKVYDCGCNYDTVDMYVAW